MFSFFLIPILLCCGTLFKLLHSNSHTCKEVCSSKVFETCSCVMGKSKRSTSIIREVENGERVEWKTVEDRKFCSSFLIPVIISMFEFKKSI